MFCSMSVPISYFGYAPSFLGQISHDTIIVASFPSFLNVLKLYCLVFFSWRKMQKKTKKSWQWEESLSSYLHNRSTIGHNPSRFWKVQSRATTFVFFTIFGNTIVLTSHPMDPDKYNYPLSKPGEISLFGEMQRTQMQYLIAYTSIHIYIPDFLNNCMPNFG